MRSKTLLLLIAALVISTVACKKADLSTDKGKYSYAIGYNIGKSLKNDQVDLDVNSFIAALEDALKGKESSLTMEEAQQAIMNLRISLQEKRMKAAEENKAKGEAFLSQNKAKEGVHTTASGLQYRVLREGTGPKPKATDVVTVHYTGRLIDGTEFDSSYKETNLQNFSWIL